MFNRINWLIHNVIVAKEIVSSETENITITNHKVAAILSCDIVANDGWSIPTTFPQQTVKQLEVTQNVVSSELTKLKDLVPS